MIGIYRITNIITGENYVGQSKDIERRWQEHDDMLLNNKHHSKKLQNAFNIYGPYVFIKTVVKIYNVYDKECLNRDERMYIQVFNSYYRGYNMKRDG